MTFRIMSDVELTRLQVLRDLDKQAITAAVAGQLLRLERRQVFRLLKAYRTVGVDGLISKKRGRPSNRSKPEEVRSTTMALVRERYPDFGPTFAAEKLRELHGIELARETLRNWMIADGLWADRKRRHKRVHQPRYRRDCVGELIQIDGSDHRWFEDRAPACTLLVFIDDATSRLMHLQFVETESAFAYFTATRSYIEAHGKPVAFYSDKHSVFRVSNRESVSVTLPDTLTDAVQRHFGVDPDRFYAPMASAQTLADAATAYTAEFSTGAGSRSVGVPLLVHRRCAEPMFGISNAVAYDRQMVQSKRSMPSAIGEVLGPSRWIEVDGAATEK